MKCNILHETPGRMRVHLALRRMSLREADLLEYDLKGVAGVVSVKVFDRTQDAVITYTCPRADIVRALSSFSFTSERALARLPEHTSRALNREYEDKLVFTVCRRAFSRLFLPYPITTAIALFRSVKYIRAGLSALLHGKLSVAVLDATAVTVSMVRGDFDTAGSVMFMLRLGEILEEWTHKKSVADLAGAMALNVDKVWLQSGETELLVPIGDVKPGDRMIVRTGNLIPLDGKVVSGEATVNQASITGESMPAPKREGSYVYAGTVVEEGECIVNVEKALGGGRYDRIVHMIEESEKLKSTAEDKAARLADRLVPYTLGGTALTYLVTRNVTKMLAVLMVDFSCALKLSMPIAVLSAMRECSNYKISVKGGKFLEAVSEADTVVFDKTGTMTQGVFEVSGIHHNEMPDEKLLEYAALAECSSSHPISKSLQKAYGKPIDRNRVTDIEEISGNGVIAKVDGISVAAGNTKLMNRLGIAYQDCHHVGTVVHMAIDGKYAGHILISDIIKPHAKEAIAELKKAGISKTVMLTGDSKRVADQVAGELGIQEVYSELLPADKVSRVEELLNQKSEKDKLAFVGDGINDAPVLSRADIGIAMGALGSDAAIEAADIVLMDDDPLKISKAIKIARKCIRIVYENIYFAIGIKVLFLLLGAIGIANMWMAIFADVGVMILAVLNAIRALFVKNL